MLRDLARISPCFCCIINFVGLCQDKTKVQGILGEGVEAVRGDCFHSIQEGLCQQVAQPPRPASEAHQVSRCVFEI